MYKQYIKRIIDFCLCIVAIITFSPFLAIVALLIRFNLGSPVLFKQKRVGKGNKTFTLYKFRTMSEARDANGVYLSDVERLTKFGKFLRNSSIDELPELFNIIMGDLSIIGPRPLPVRYLKRYTEEQLRRHEVLPGLSCVDSIKGRNLLQWDEKFALDTWYVDNISFKVDVNIILKTIAVVFNRKGSTSQNGESRCEFWGTAEIGVSEDETDYIKT